MPLNAEGSFHSDFARLPVTAALLHHQGLRQLPRAPPRLSRLRAGSRSRTCAKGLRTGLRPAQGDPRRASRARSPSTSSPTWRRASSGSPSRLSRRGVAEADRERLRAEGRAAIQKDVLPAYSAFLEFMTKEYIPEAARTSVAASDLPEGREYYAWRVKHFTTLDVTPDEVHAIGPQRRSRASGPRWTRSEAGAVGEGLRRVPRVPAHRPALLPEERRGAAEGGLVHREEDGRQAPRLLQDPAAAALRRRAGARRHRPEVHRRAATAARPSTARARACTGSTPTPSRPAPSTPSRRSPCTRRCPATTCRRALQQELQNVPELPPPRLRERLRRGLGPLLGAAGPRGGLLQGPLQQLRPADLRDVARLPARGGHRHAREGLDARPGARSTWPRTRPSRCTRSRPRPTATSAGPARPSPTRWAS